MQEEYTKRNPIYFENLPTWPKFDVFDKNIDDVIPVTRLKGWKQIDEMVRHFRSDEGGDEYIFRGQHNYRWFLSPTLSRLSGEVLIKKLQVNSYEILS
jgi:hypothetical protein